jgi:hypothetical protein
MITMLLGGLWHGANWTFMLWGGLHGTYLVINHAWRNVVDRFGWQPPQTFRWATQALSVLVTFAATTLAWVVFRSPDLATAGNVMRGLAGGGSSHLVSFSPLAAAALVVLFAVVWFAPNSMEIMWAYRPALEPPRGTSQVRDIGRWRWQPSRSGAIAYGALCVAAMLALSNLSPFIYFQF